MKIVSIFEKRLYSFKFDGESVDELARVLDLWSDVSYVFNFLNNNKLLIPNDTTISKLTSEIIEDAKQVGSWLLKLDEDSSMTLDTFFKPLDNNETSSDVALSMQKGRSKRKKGVLRIYAIRIDAGLYAITGGAIKLTDKMDEQKETKNELVKLNQCKDFLKEEGVYDKEAFFEFILL